MTETIKQTLRDSKIARWSILFLISLTMASGYFFNDILSPLEELLISSLKWDGDQYGVYVGQYSFLNIIGFIVLGGILLDRLGIRFTGICFLSLMLMGALIKAYGLSNYFNNGGFGYEFFNSFLPKYKPSMKLATLGFALFGLGIEIVGITANRIIVKWYKGKELAMAMGLQMAIARLGMGCAFIFSPRIANDVSAYKPVIFAVLILCIGLLTFLIHCIADIKLDKGLEQEKEKSSSEKFRFADILGLIKNKGFVLITCLCVLFYSCVFPFTKFVANLFMNKYGVDAQTAGDISFILPIGTIILTPIFGGYIDKKGKGASMMMLGSILLIISHSIFTFLPGEVIFAYSAMFILGIGFSLVPSAMWPSIPKLVNDKLLGTAYSLVFWIQNIGLWLIPMIIGRLREWSNPGVTLKKQQGIDIAYDYTNPILLLVLLAFSALIFSIFLKKADKRMGYGLENPNIIK